LDADSNRVCSHLPGRLDDESEVITEEFGAAMLINRILRE